eukprot:SAG31_NODE_46229_length_255_cov_0.839744_1_plen_33_part_10
MTAEARLQREEVTEGKETALDALRWIQVGLLDC